MYFRFFAKKRLRSSVRNDILTKEQMFANSEENK